MSKILSSKTSLMFSIVIFMCFTATQLFGADTSSIDEELLKEANNMNMKCPFMVDKYTRLDSTFAVEGKKFVYSYTIIDDELMNTIKNNRYKISAEIKTKMINSIKTNQDTKELRDVGVEFVYIYKANDGKEIVRIIISPSDYK